MHSINITTQKHNHKARQHKTEEEVACTYLGCTDSEVVPRIHCRRALLEGLAVDELRVPPSGLLRVPRVYKEYTHTKANSSDALPKQSAPQNTTNIDHLDEKNGKRVSRLNSCCIFGVEGHWEIRRKQ